MEAHLFELLHECTVRLSVPKGQGTGFFVAPGIILTCAHVVEQAKDSPSGLKVHYKDKEYAALSVNAFPGPYPDIALIRIDLNDHPCVFLDSRVESGDEMLAYGYTQNYPGGESTTIEYEGPARFHEGQWLLKFKGGQIIPGYSGSPMLNMRTWAICGLVKSTRDRATDLGGGGIPVEVVLAQLPELVKLQNMFHNWDSRWADAARQQQESRNAGLPMPVVTIVVGGSAYRTAVNIAEIDLAHLELQTILRELWSPVSVDWYSEDHIALGSRDSFVRVAGLDGQIQQKISVTAYPSYVTVHNQRRLAALCYTRLYVIDLHTGNVQSVEVDVSSIHTAAWSPDGEYIAVGATNTLKIFTADLNLVAEHHLAGKYGAPCLDWGHNEATIYVGIGNGELWRISKPFDSPTVLFKAPSPALGLRSSQIDGRLACLWRDGSLEVRKEKELLASLTIQGTDVWSANGPKVAWWLDDTALACITGMSNEVIFWQFGTERAFSCRLERRVLALDVSPTGHALVLGVDEKDRQDAWVSILSLAKAAAALAEASPVREKEVQHHLLSADWTRLTDWIEDRDRGIEPTFNLKLSIPPADAYLASYEESLRKADAEPEILRTLKRELEVARKDLEGILDDLLWAGEQMRQAGFFERDIRLACDRVVSFSVNRVIGGLGIPKFPQITSLGEFVAFTLGCNPEELLYLGFDANDGRGNVAYVPIEFLMSVQELSRIGETLGEKYGAKAGAQKISIACQLFHEFDYAFSSYEQKDLWIKFVLPLSVVRYPREQVIIRPSDIRRFGLA